MTETQDARQKWAAELAELVEKQIRGRHLAAHLYARLALLLQTEEVRFAQVALQETRRYVNGDLFVWTDRYLAVAQFSTVAITYPQEERSFLEDHRDASVSVRLIPRATLRGLLLPNLADGVSINDGATWNWKIEGGDWSWPQGASLSLDYRDLDKPLMLPGSGDVDAFERLIPSLLDDLAAN
ncbi:hypothetical protein [Modestobacter sp. VKM Ac-2985]|uniref:hypothetical protein n=1 Tax=Modestobacter sp. VKM Ac-2985 TaxID=3004139 RepID=UPI0022AB8FCC|nr:hypothetical protein [Modestobacter sp. VKM Ac-2985]MCZ2839914.1 hypothetical protein [Modestobacter sp. VKM Ac-2985]